jgi:hypothetical protein
VNQIKAKFVSNISFSTTSTVNKYLLVTTQSRTSVKKLMIPPDGHYWQTNLKNLKDALNSKASNTRIAQLHVGM